MLISNSRKQNNKETEWFLTNKTFVLGVNVANENVFKCFSWSCIKNTGLLSQKHQGNALLLHTGSKVMDLALDV